MATEASTDTDESFVMVMMVHNRSRFRHGSSLGLFLCVLVIASGFSGRASGFLTSAEEVNSVKAPPVLWSMFDNREEIRGEGVGEARVQIGNLRPDDTDRDTDEAPGKPEISLVPGLWATAIYGVDWRAFARPSASIIAGFVPPSGGGSDHLPISERIRNNLAMTGETAIFGGARLEFRDGPLQAQAGIGLGFAAPGSPDSIGNSIGSGKQRAGLTSLGAPHAATGLSEEEVDARINAFLRVGVANYFSQNAHLQSYFVVTYAQNLPVGLRKRTIRQQGSTTHTGSNLAIGAGFDLLSSAWFRANIQASYLALGGTRGSEFVLGGGVRISF